MKLLIASDIHTEFHADGGRGIIRELADAARDADVVVIAGDFGDSYGIYSDLHDLCRVVAPRPVIFVAGNHEFYGGHAPSTGITLRRFAHHAKVANLHVLERDTLVLDGVRFAGATLWFRDHPDNARHAHRLNDFHQIRGFVPWVYDQNRKAEALLGMLPADVVITHHLPSTKCIFPPFEDSPLNRFFVTPIADDLKQLPRLWLYGHTHTAADFEHRGCRFVTNPMGYPGENPGWTPKIVEITP